MARLEWKEVEAPDFKGSSAGYLAASRLFSEAIDSAKSGLQDFQKTSTEQADNAVLEGLMAYQGKDPAELEKAMQDGSFLNQFDPSVRKNLSAGTRQTLLTRPAALLEHAVKTAEFGEQKKSIAQADVVRANQGDINTYMQLKDADARDGTDTAAAFLGNKPDLVKALSVGNFGKVMEGGQDIFRTETSNQSSAFKHGEEVTGYKEGRAVTDLTAQLRARTESLDDVDQILNGDEGVKLREQYGAQVLAGVRRNLQGEYGGGASAGSSGSGGGAAYAGNGSTYVGGANAGTPEQHSEMASALGGFGFNSNVVAGALGNSMIEGGYKGGMGDGGTAAGHFQWRGDRQANFQKVIGKPVAQATPADSAKFFKWEFDNPESSGAFVKNKDGTTPVQQRDMILNAKTPAEAAELIDKYYERSDGKARGQRISAANAFAANGALQTGLKSEISGDQASDAARDWEENWSSKSTAAEVGASLSTLPLFKGEEGDYLATKIDEVMAMAPGKINAATAGAILKRSKNGRKSSWNPDTWEINPWGSGVKASFNEDRIAQEVALIADPKALAQQTLKTNALGQGITDQATAQNNLKVAQQALAAKKQRAAASGKKLNLADEELAVANAQAALEGGNEAAGGLYDAARGGENNSNERGGANPRVVNEAANPDGSKKKPATTTAKVTPPTAKKVDGILASGVTQGAAPRTPLPTAKDINASLAQVREAGAAFNQVKDKPLAFRAGPRQAYERSVNIAVGNAIRSGLAQFQRKPNESAAAHQMRVEKLLLNGRTR